MRDSPFLQFKKDKNQRFTISDAEYTEFEHNLAICHLKTSKFRSETEGFEKAELLLNNNQEILSFEETQVRGFFVQCSYTPKKQLFFFF